MSESRDELELPSVDVEAFASEIVGGLGEDVDETLRQAWIDEMEQLLQKADRNFATRRAGIELEKDEGGYEYWQELAEDVSRRAYYFRAALILRDGQFNDEGEFQDLINEAVTLAENEKKTIAEFPWFAEHYPWAFPATWSERVETHLKPPTDLDLARAASELSSEHDSLKERADAVGPDVYKQGLPVPFVEALSFESFPFRWSYDRSRLESIKNFAIQAKEWIKAYVTHKVAKNWQRGKETLVNDIDQGKKVIDTDEWHLVSERDSQPDLDWLVNEAVSQDISLAATKADEIDGWEYELALAKSAKYVEPIYTEDAYRIVRNVFEMALGVADDLVAKTDPSDRIDLANRWASNWGYGAAAFDMIGKAIKENADEIAIDIAKDAAISAIPVVGWFWIGKEIIEEGVDLYNAGMSIYRARERAESATTVVALQRTAAEMTMAEYSGAATVAMTAVSEGVSFGARRGMKRQRKGEPGTDTSADPRRRHEVPDPDAAAREAEGDSFSPVDTTTNLRQPSPADAGIEAALTILRSEFPVLNEVRLNAERIERVIRARNDSHAKGQLLEELMSATIHQRMATREGRAELGLSEAQTGERQFIEGYRIKLNGKQITDGIIGYYDDATGVFRIEAVLEAKAGDSAAKSLVTSGTEIKKMSKYDKSQLVREIHQAAESELDEFVAVNYSSALSRLRGFEYDKLPDDVINAIVGNRDLRSSTVSSMTEAGQIRRDIERLFPTTGPDKENLGPLDFDDTALNIEDIRDPVSVTLSPTQTKFLGIVPSDVDTAKLSAELRDEFNFSAESIGIESADLERLVMRLRALEPLFQR